MQARTRTLWESYQTHPGDRDRLFEAVAGFTGPGSVLYPGSYIDLAPSRFFDEVTYVDKDRKAVRFFSDEAGVDEIIGRPGARWRFLAGDYSGDLGLEDGSFDLVVSLYAGFVSEACTRYLRSGGLLLVNPSHGDAALASLDGRYSLAGVITSRSGEYRVRSDDLDSYLLPKGATPTVESVKAAGRGVAYTRSAFAYLFERA